MSGAAELLYGNRAAADVTLAPVPLDTAASDTVVIEDAEILYVLYEMPMARALERLPSSLHPSVPALLGFTFVSARGGPLGAFTIAWHGIACRTGIKPRHLIQGAWCDGARAVEFFASRYGFACRPAAVTLRETFDRVRGSVALDGTTLIDLAITDGLPLVGAGALIKYSPPLNATTLDGAPALVQFEAGYDFKRVLRGRPRLACFDAAALGDAGLAPTTPIAGSHAVVDLHLMPARFQVDLSTPAEAGGARKIAR
ncbi:MAG: acetoacetate decarboxylase family protein [Gammaproteobacteria bacterium]